MGHPEEAPYDAIHVGAAAPNVPQAVSFRTAEKNTHERRDCPPLVNESHIGPICHPTHQGMLSGMPLEHTHTHTVLILTLLKIKKIYCIVTVCFDRSTNLRLINSMFLFVRQTSMQL